MITGEVERIMGTPLNESDFDPFFGNKKKRLARRAKRQIRRKARRLKRQQQGGFFSRLGQTYREAGGATGIGTAIDAMTNPEYDGMEQPDQDVDFSMGGSDQIIPQGDKGFPTIIVVLGGVALLGVTGLILLNKKKQQQR